MVTNTRRIAPRGRRPSARLAKAIQGAFDRMKPKHPKPRRTFPQVAKEWNRRSGENLDRHQVAAIHDAALAKIRAALGGTRPTDN